MSLGSILLDGAAPVLTVLTGPPGVGRTHALRELRTAAVRAGRPVVDVRLAPEDRTLSDAQWRHIAGELMAQAGLAPHADEGSVRWVAIRHGDDHIHIVATLARQDGRSIRNFRDYFRLRAACRHLESRYRLRSTVGDSPEYRYERDVEQFFRHSPAVVREEG